MTALGKILVFVNLVFALFGGGLGLIYYGPGQKAGLIPILFALACVAIGALTFIIDFDAAEKGVRYGLPERYAWYSAFGMLVGLNVAFVPAGAAKFGGLSWIGWASFWPAASAIPKRASGLLYR